MPGRGRPRTVHRRQKLSQGHQGGVPAAQGPARGRRDRRRHQRDALGADRHPGQGVPAAGGFALCRFVVLLLLFVLNLQTHLICTVPPYISQDICEPVVVQIFIVSAGKRSETHNFTFTPKGHHTALSASTTTTGSFFGLGGGDEIGPSGPAASVGGGNTGPASFNSLNSSFSSNQSEGKHLNCGLTERIFADSLPVWRGGARYRASRWFTRSKRMYARLLEGPAYVWSERDYRNIRQLPTRRSSSC